MPEIKPFKIRDIEIKPSPRVGVAYSLDAKTVIRAGYGLLYGVAYDGATRAFTSSAFQTSTPWVNSVDKIHPNTLFANPFPSGFVYPPGNSQGLLSAIGLSLASAQPSTLRTAYNQQWNFSIQRSSPPTCCCRCAWATRELTWRGAEAAAQLG
jgi:hypothetical protein